MSDKTTNHDRKHAGGRPLEGYEQKSYRITIRLERYVYEELKRKCRLLGIKPSDALREGVRLFMIHYREEN